MDSKMLSDDSWFDVVSFFDTRGLVNLQFVNTLIYKICRAIGKLDWDPVWFKSMKTHGFRDLLKQFQWNPKIQFNHSMLSQLPRMHRCLVLVSIKSVNQIVQPLEYSKFVHNCTRMYYGNPVIRQLFDMSQFTRAYYTIKPKYQTTNNRLNQVDLLRNNFGCNSKFATEFIIQCLKMGLKISWFESFFVCGLLDTYRLFGFLFQCDSDQSNEFFEDPSTSIEKIRKSFIDDYCDNQFLSYCGSQKNYDFVDKLVEQKFSTQDKTKTTSRDNYEIGDPLWFHGNRTRQTKFPYLLGVEINAGVNPKVMKPNRWNTGFKTGCNPKSIIKQKKKQYNRKTKRVDTKKLCVS
jgi:hypothetical protein